MIRKLLLVTVLLVAFVAPSASASELFKLIPQEADFVFHVNVGKFLSTEAVKTSIMDNLSAQSEQKEAFDKFVAKTGFNPFENLTKVVIFSSGKVNPAVPGQFAGAIFQGKFDAAKIFAAIKEDENASKEVEIKKIDGFDAVIPKNRQEGYGVFLDASTVVIGAEHGVMAVKDVKLKKAKSIEERKDFFKIVSALDANATIAGAGNIPEELKARVKENPQAAPLAALNYFFFSFNHGDNIVFNFNGAVDKKENVETVLTSLNGFLAMLKMFTAQAPEAAEILNLVKISSKDSNVQINLNVPKATLDKIKAQMEARMKSMQEQQEGTKMEIERD